MSLPDAVPVTRAAAVEEGERLSRELSAPQLAMIAIGGAIGTGLFLGSALAVHTAGPGVILTYVIGAAIALLLMRALGEMAVAHPTAGSFGIYAELYLGRWAGFTVRYTYWAAQCVAIGGEATAIAIYCQWWFPHTPQWFWILAFTIALLYVNARGVGSFGAFEYWFAMIKVVAIVMFIAVGMALLLGWTARPRHRFFKPDRLWRLPADWPARRVDGDCVRHLQLRGHGSGRGHRRRGQESGSRSTARLSRHGRALDCFLSRRSVRAGRHRSLDPDSTRRRSDRESLCAGLSVDWHSRRCAYRQFCGCHGGRLQHELRFVFSQPHDVFAGPRRLCSPVVGPRLIARGARARAAGFRRRARPGDARLHSSIPAARTFTYLASRFSAAFTPGSSFL